MSVWQPLHHRSTVLAATTLIAFSNISCAQNSTKPATSAAKPASAASFTVWVEGESAGVKDVKPHPWWYDQVKKDQLSSGAWLSNFNEEKHVGTAEYTVEIPAAAKYNFWLRANPVQAKLMYQIGDAAWKQVNFEGALDQQNLAADGKPDLRFLAWQKVGNFDLPKGATKVRFRMESENSNHGAIDAFTFTTLNWTPNGIQKPGATAQTVALASTGATWPFEYSKDNFGSDAVLNLRYLNEKVAGESGFLKLSPDGNSFLLGNDKPVKFWAVNTTVFRQSDENLTQHARFLAKIGVNMVRMHGSISPKKEGAKLTDIDEEEIDRAFRLVAAMKKEGIYSTISPFWANGGHAGVRESWGLDGYGDKNDIWGLMFFNDDLKNAYKGWVRELYTRKNPYTGVALKDEPAVGIIQVKNEDSLLFWTTQAIKPQQMRLFEAKFGDWLIKKYGSLPKAFEAWEGSKADDDNAGEGRAGILQIWEMTQAQSGGKARRIRDQVEFFGQTQYNFYKEIGDFYRSIGCKQLINANNWITADNEKLGDIERWTYTANDVSAVNKYFNGGQHIGPNNGWRIDPGDIFEGKSALTQPQSLPTSLKQTVGLPMMVTESSWVPPLGLQSEGPFLMAAYQSLTGVDNYYWFSADAPGYHTEPYFPWHTFPDGQKGLFKWNLPPAVQTQFPAAALAYRLNYIKPGATVVHEERSLQNMWERTTPVITEGQSFDPNRQTNFAEGTPVQSVVNPLAFVVGRVEVKYGGDPSKTKVADLSKFIDEANKTVTSTTGEIKLNYGKGWCMLDTPKAQGATGFLKEAGTISLADVTLQSGNEYATVLAVPLDDQPLKTSKRVLVQVGTTMRPTGWQTEKGQFKTEDGKQTITGEKIVNTGKMPYQVANTDVTFSLKNATLKKATLLDVSGYRKGSVPVTSSAGTLKVKLPANAIYLVLE